MSHDILDQVVGEIRELVPQKLIFSEIESADVSLCRVVGLLSICTNW